MGAVAELCLERHFSAERLNELANHPAIRPTCGGDGKSQLDLTSFVEDHRNHLAVWEHGAFMFHYAGPGTYEVHMMVLPEGRGKDGYRMAKEGIDYIVSQGAETLTARVPLMHDAVRHYAAHAGFERVDLDVIDIGFGPEIYDIYQWSKPCHRQ
jgi:hypothetical protein